MTELESLRQQVEELTFENLHYSRLYSAVRKYFRTIADSDRHRLAERAMYDVMHEINDMMEHDRA